MLNPSQGLDSGTTSDAKTMASYITQDDKIYRLHYFNQQTDLNIFSWLVGFKFCESFRLAFQLAGD